MTTVVIVTIYVEEQRTLGDEPVKNNEQEDCSCVTKHQGIMPVRHDLVNNCMYKQQAWISDENARGNFGSVLLRYQLIKVRSHHTNSGPLRKSNAEEEPLHDINILAHHNSGVKNKLHHLADQGCLSSSKQVCCLGHHDGWDGKTKKVNGAHQSNKFFVNTGEI